MKRTILIAVPLLLTLLMAGNAHGLALDKESKVTVTIGNHFSVDLYAAAGQANNYYYVPSRVRVAAGRDGRPKITILTYISDGSEGASGGTFNALVTWALTKREEDQIRAELRNIRAGARLMGAAPVERVEEGPSVNVLVALGGDEKIAWSGTAPLQPGGRAAVAANLSPIGASILDAGIAEGNLAGVTVEMNFLLPFKADLGNCQVTVDWSSFSRDFESVDFSQGKGGDDWWSLRASWKNLDENHTVARSAIERGHVRNSCDYDRANLEQQRFFESAIETFLASALGASAEGQAAADEADRSTEGDEDEAPLSGGDWDRYNYEYTKEIISQKSGIEILELRRSIVVRDPVPAVIGNVKEWITGNEDSPGVRIRSINLSSTEFNQIPVSFSVGENALAMFGLEDGVKASLNNVTVNIRKQRSQGGDYRDFHVFSKKEILEGLTDHQFEYARGSEREPFEYDYSVTWSFVGQRPREGSFQRSNGGAHTLEPDAASASVIFRGNSYALDESNILGVTAEIKHRFLGRERTSYMNVFAGDDAQQNATLFLDNSARTIAYRTVFTHAVHGELATPWAVKSVPNSGSLPIFAVIPESLTTEDPSFISRATRAVGSEADRKLDDVLSEFDKL